MRVLPALQWVLAGMGCVLVMAGCASSDFGEQRLLRPAVAVPDHFMVGSFTGDALSEPTPGGGCRSPMVDPRDGARLILVRSGAGQGDYAVPAAGRYGVNAGELLRLDCATGRALGVVRE